MDDFLAAHLPAFGLLGTNNLILASGNHDVELTDTGTQKSHFKFGFDGVSYSSKPYTSARYWTAYGQPTRRHQGFRAELIAALRDIHQRVGWFSLSASRSCVSDAVTAAANAAGIAVEHISIVLDSERSANEFDGARTFMFDFEEFASFADAFASETGCCEPWIALDALHGQLSDLPHLYSQGTIRIVNNNFDARSKSDVGPPNWSIVDSENATAINRFLTPTNRPGFTQIFRYSPEIIAAQLDSEVWRNWLRGAAARQGATRSSRHDNQRAQQALIHAELKCGATPEKAADAWARTSIPQKMGDLRRQLILKYAPCEGVHLNPLPRFAAWHGVKYPFYIGEHETIYGSVS